jgi:hypothetical protein
VIADVLKRIGAHSVHPDLAAGQDGGEMCPVADLRFTKDVRDRVGVDHVVSPSSRLAGRTE